MHFINLTNPLELQTSNITSVSATCYGYSDGVVVVEVVGGNIPYEYQLLDVNNTSYIDGFFTYLSSQLMHHYGFIHGLDYYGCFLGNQREFKYNIIDDIDYLNDSDFFHEKKGKLFSVDNNEYNENDDEYIV